MLDDEGDDDPELEALQKEMLAAKAAKSAS